MNRYTKKMLLCMAVVLSFMLLLWFANKNWWIIVECTFCDGKVSTDTITVLEDNRTFIISPYYDNRTAQRPVVRILSIIHHRKVKNLYCCFCCTTNKCVLTKALIDKHKESLSGHYVTTDILCAEPPNCHAKYVSVQTSLSREIRQLPIFQIQNRDVKPFSANFTVCISTIFGNYSNVLQFIQTMEMYQILGAQRVMIYLNNNCSPQMEKVMHYYIAKGILEVVDWPIQRYLSPGKAWHYSMDPGDVGYYSELAPLNDCIYRNMYRSRFVVLNDIDEIILPLSHMSWNTMMERLQLWKPKATIFLFENHIFPQTAPTDGNFSDITTWKDVPGYNILQYVQREPNKPNSFNDQKMIVDPRKVIEASIDSVLKSRGVQVNVPLKTALVYHCREPLRRKLPKTSLVEDKTIWRHNVSLIKNVNKVLGEISFQ